MRGVASFIRRGQTGFVRTYALGMLGGAVLVAGALAWATGHAGPMTRPMLPVTAVGWTRIAPAKSPGSVEAQLS